MAELHDLSALEQASAVRRGEVSCAELVEHYVARIDAVDPSVGAFVTRTTEQARATASAPLPDSPLAGVPTGIKDLNLTAGVATQFGSRAFAGFVPPVSDTVVDRVAGAGMPSLGKTATPELGLPCYTEDGAAPTRNPWDLSRSPGGSSGGAGAAVAAGMLPVAPGSDGGGSIRIPASVNGLVGLKTSRGRITSGPVVGDLTGLAVHGPLARTVRDAAALLDVMAGPGVGDPHWAPPPATSFLSACDAPQRPLRVGMTRDSVVDGAAVDPEVAAAHDATAHLLEQMGHDVDEIALPYGPELIGAFETVWGVSAASAPVPPESEELLTPLTRWLRERGRATSGVQFVSAVATLQAAARRGIGATAAYDVLLLPTLAQLPAPIGWFTGAGDPAADFERQKRWTPFTAVFNMTGQPAISLPLHVSATGLPIGMMLVGRPTDEMTLLALGAQLEDALPWRDRHPACW